jgi:hypothetical protein
MECQCLRGERAQRANEISQDFSLTSIQRHKNFSTQSGDAAGRMGGRCLSDLAIVPPSLKRTRPPAPPLLAILHGAGDLVAPTATHTQAGAPLENAARMPASWPSVPPSRVDKYA